MIAVRAIRSELMSTRPRPVDPTVVSDLQRPLWNRSAAAYADAFEGLVDQAVEPLLDAAGIAAGSRVLDVATGPGIIAAAALKRGAAAKGIDFAENMVAVARKHHPSIEFMVADAGDLPFEDGDFDAVLMGFALFMMAEPDRALREAHRVLKPGGRLACTVWDWPVPGFDLFYESMARFVPEEPVLGGNPPLFGVSDRDVLQAVLAEAAFANVAVKSLPIVWELVSPDELFDALATLRDFGSFPGDRMNSFRSEVAAGAQKYKRGGSYFIPFPALLLSGTRL
jgi:ubiquinone/menaquinone biosynthesis C-methylase UbiE